MYWIMFTNIHLKLTGNQLLCEQMWAGRSVYWIKLISKLQIGINTHNATFTNYYIYFQVTTTSIIIIIIIIIIINPPFNRI